MASLKIQYEEQDNRKNKVGVRGKKYLSNYLVFWTNVKKI